MNDDSPEEQCFIDEFFRPFDYLNSLEGLQDFAALLREITPRVPIPENLLQFDEQDKIISTQQKTTDGQL